MTLFSSFLSLLFWQFSQFVLTCEVAILITMYATGIIERQKLTNILSWISVSTMS